MAAVINLAAVFLSWLRTQSAPFGLSEVSAAVGVPTDPQVVLQAAIRVGAAEKINENSWKSLIFSQNSVKKPALPKRSRKQEDTQEKSGEGRLLGRISSKNPSILAQKAAVAKRVISTGPIRVSLGDETDNAKAFAIASAYEELLGIYIFKPALRYVKGKVSPGSPCFGNWLAAANLADECEIDYFTYVKAQFFAYHTWYSRAPKPQELATYRSNCNAKNRVKLYLNAIDSGLISAETNIVGKQSKIIDTTTKQGRKAARSEIPESVRFRNSENQLRQLMKNYDVSAEKILKVFAKNQEISQLFFDSDWLHQNETYRQLLSAGEIHDA